ncbi:MAG: TonB-dependent receptor [Erythrobacter sp.]|uniref:TonB-dependent receptor n=1 Tax=Erythrobacter sp. TaxID=1042 RepID=UPI00326716EF
MIKRSEAASKTVARSLLLSASTIGLLTAMPAAAQDASEDAEANDDVQEGDIVVTGIRASIATAQQTKRDADTVVDVVTASDIGALPDRSVSEVLQRVPGVSVIRFAGPNDPDHFAVEGSGVVIRGLPFVRSELNGRDVFGANSGGVLGFEDVSPELLGSVVVFKNSSADLIEGGAAGTIDLRTRLPFDQSGQVVSFSIEGNYGDLREEWSPTVSALYSNTFDTAVGTFGILGNIAYSELKSRADGTGLADFVETDNGFVPSGGSIRTQEFDRERLTIAGAAQFESNDGRWLATAQFLRSDSELIWGENALETVADSAGARANLDSSDFVFDDDGIFTGGTISDDNQWRGPNGGDLLPPAFFPGAGGQQLNLFRERLEEDVTTDYGFNLKFSPTDNLRFNFDVQYIKSSAEVIDLTVHGSFFSRLFVDSSVGSVPEVSNLAPVNQPADYFQDPSNYFLRSVLDHNTQNDADSLAFKGDVEYDFSGDGWLKSVRAGGRYQQQDSTLRESDFNWGNISEVWTGRDLQGLAAGENPVLLLGGNPNPALNALVDPLFGSFEFDNYQRGLNTGLGGPIPTYTGPGVEDFQGFQDTFNNIIDVLYGPNGISPTGNNLSPSGYRPLTGRAGVIEGTPFLPSEIGQIERDNFAAYVRLDFEQPSGDYPSLSGNVGLRYVRTERSVDSSFSIPSFQETFPNTALCDPAFQAANGIVNIPGFCDLDLVALEAALSDGVDLSRTLETSYDEFLPSLNLKMDIDDQQVVRLAVSRTMTRPGVNQLNERITVRTLTSSAIPDGSGGSFTPFEGFVGNATGNSALLPQTSWNFDVSWEWYFAPAGSITLAGFHKEIDNFISFAPVLVGLPEDDLSDAFLSNSVINPLLRNTEVNSEESASVTGFEFAYQQFFDFLPGVLSGLGMQFNYTYIDSKGVANELDATIPSDDPPTARFDVDAGLFPRISEHNLNAIALYEKGPVQARLAYNWRSSFQLTPRDVIFPFASIYQPATGQLDASLFYDLTDNIKLGVQGVNLLDDITVTEQSIDEDGLLAPRNFFRNDRRYTVILRATF